MNHRRARDAVVSVSLFGLWLLMPPVIGLFDRPVFLAGMPLIVVYIFGVWLGLVVVAVLLSRCLPDERDAAVGRPLRGGGAG